MDVIGLFCQQFPNTWKASLKFVVAQPVKMPKASG